MDVEGGKPYPVFDALRGSGTERHVHLPRPGAERLRATGRMRNRWVADRDATLVTTAGHLHPGGLYTDLFLTRGGVTKRLFRSRADYFEPAGAVSWDVVDERDRPELEGRDQEGRRALHDRDLRHHHAPPGTRSWASWSSASRRRADGGVDPFTGDVDQTDYLTHGRLPENVDIGVRRPNPGLSNPLRLRGGPLRDRDRHQELRLPAGRPDAARQAGPAADRPAGQAADVRQRGQPADDPLPHDHRL